MREIEDFIKETVLDETQFNICHELHGHCLTEHILDLKDLQTKLWNMPKPTADEPIVAASRFLSKEIALKTISETLLKNVDEIINWRKKLLLPELVVIADFEEAIGDAIVKDADRGKPIPMHRCRIVLYNGDLFGQPFYIKTAYPSRTPDDIDACYDAMEEWEEKKKNKQKR